MKKFCCCKDLCNNPPECDVHSPRDLESAKRTLSELYIAWTDACKFHSHEYRDRTALQKENEELRDIIEEASNAISKGENHADNRSEV